MSDMISRKDAIAAIVDVQSRTDTIVFGNSIHRPPVSVQEAAKVLLNDRAAFARMVDVAEDIHCTGVSFNRVVGDALRAIAEGEKP